MDIIVEKNVPRTAAPRGAPPKKYPFKNMAIEDSFFVPSVEARDGARLRNAASGYGQRSGKVFCVHNVKDGFRCWRVK